MPDEFDEDTMYITYQTGKGSDHSVPVMFPHETIKGMQCLTNAKVWANVGVNKDNLYVFASTQNSKGDAYMDGITSMKYLKGSHWKAHLMLQETDTG